MCHRSKGWGWLAISGGVILGLASPAHAAAGPFRKLVRGLTNTVTGVLEIPFEIARTTENEGSIAGVTVGVARGTGLAIKRTVLGAWEAVSFPFPNYPHLERAGRASYEPLTQPEFVVFRPVDKYHP